VPDPADPEIVYGAGLGGKITRWDARTGQVQDVSPWPVSTYGARPGSGRYRYDWITPLAIAPRPPHAIYSGAQVLFRSLDGGRSWATASPDLTGADPNATGCDGDVPVERATACGFGTIFAIAPSPAADSVVWMGTDNGRVLRTSDDAKSWTDVTPKPLADWTKVNHIDASPTDAATAYVAADAHRRDDFRPTAYRTHDGGAHWTEIGHGLPAGAWVDVVRQDPERAGLLYAGTSRGIHVSFDDGDTWRSLQLNLPTTGINDLRVHGDDLVAATDGRAIWILDRLAPLRSAAAPAPSALLSPPGRVYRRRGNENRDTPLPPEEPAGENPPEGAILDYVLPAGFAGTATLEILDPAGEVVRRWSSAETPAKPEAEVYFTDRYLGEGARLSAAPGHHRFTWNLRYERPPALKYEYSIAAVAGRATPALPQGSFVLPGAYRVRLSAGGATVERPIEVAMDPRVGAPREDLVRLLDFQRLVARSLARSADLERARRRAEKLLAAAHIDPRAKKLAEPIARRQAELAKLTARSEEDPGAANAVLASLEADLEGADAAPTAPQREALSAYDRGMDAFEPEWRSFEAGPFAALARRLAGLGLNAGDL
jgi:hypothetical protein